VEQVKWGILEADGRISFIALDGSGLRRKPQEQRYP
jgi:uncharacterized membrane protein YcaP (DUF421 family)